MKRLLVALALAALCAGTAQGGIVNNSGTTAEDSLAIQFQLMDSLWNPVVAVTGDSAWLFVWYPGGELAFTDSVRLLTDAKISVRNLDVGAHSMAFYTYQNAIADVDGAGLEGVYKWTWVAYDSTLSLATTVTGEFQLYATGNFSDKMDSTTLANVIQISGDAAAANNLETMLDGTGGQILKLGQLVISSSSADGAVDIDNSGGPGIKVATAGAADHGIHLDVEGAGAHGLFGDAALGQGIYGKGSVGIKGQATSGTNGAGLYFAGDGTGSGMKVVGGATGIGLEIIGGSSSGDGVDISATSGVGIDVYTASGDGLEIDGTVDVDADLTIATNNDKTGYGLVDSSANDIAMLGNAHPTDSGNVAAIKAKTDNLPSDPADDSDIDGQLAAIQTGIDSTAGLVAPVGNRHPTDSAFADSVANAIHADNKANFKAGSGGSGAQTDTLWVIDTSGTDAVVPSASVKICNSANTANVAWGLSTNSSGYVIYNLDASTSYTAVVARPGFIFPTQTITSGAGATDSLVVQGYNIAISAPGSASLKRVYVDCREPGLDTMLYKGIEVKCELLTYAEGSDSLAADTLNWLVFGKKSRTISRPANGFAPDGTYVGPAGRAIFDIIPNDTYHSIYSDYRFTAYLEGETLWTLTVRLTGTSQVELYSTFQGSQD